MKKIYIQAIELGFMLIFLGPAIRWEKLWFVPQTTETSVYMVYIRFVRLKSLRCWKGWSVHDMADVWQLLDMKDGLTSIVWSIYSWSTTFTCIYLLYIYTRVVYNSLLNLPDTTDFMGSLHPLLCYNSSPEFFIFHIVPNRKRWLPFWRPSNYPSYGWTNSQSPSPITKVIFSGCPF